MWVDFFAGFIDFDPIFVGLLAGYVNLYFFVDFPNAFFFIFMRVNKVRDFPVFEGAKIFCWKSKSFKFFCWRFFLQKMFSFFSDAWFLIFLFEKCVNVV